METRSSDTESSKHDTLRRIPWEGKGKGYYFVAEPLVINAAPEVVWGLVKSVDQYHVFSNEAVQVSLPQGDIKVGNTIHFVLYKNQPIGKLIPESDEKISVLDDERHILAWERAVPGGRRTESYRVLESLDEGRKTRSHIALRIPGCVGFFTSVLMKKKLEDTFNTINNGIKKAAEESKFTQ